ncbi:flagellar biosynthetic protein FliR [Lacticigenium naphthae]|uniref:flagellar biosynthetic protein FliR n=1 Tax=Lacticigenium naphthae TaxID=515351 RepID=UPI000419B754|nr:flagellar biosynthetic protein FliR [Lacticigenium naphthae]
MNTLQTFFLIFTRVASFIVIVPGFSYKGMPAISKIMLSVGLALAVYPGQQELATVLTPFVFGLFIIKEALLGLAIGFVVQLIFSAIEMAGQFVDFQVGFSMGSQYDPSLGIQVSNYGRLYYWLSILLFFLTNLHHTTIRVFVRSFDDLPITQTSYNYLGTEGIVQMIGFIFESAILLAIPLMIVALLSELVLGLISRTVPQINVLILGMPMKILVSLIFMFFFLPTLISNIGAFMPKIVEMMSEFMYALGTD